MTEIQKKENLAMPVVKIDMWVGRTPEQKKELIEAITAAFEHQGTRSDALHIIINDVSRENWGTQGKPATEL